MALKKETTYDKYDTQGNLLQYTSKAGIPTSIIWGYNATLPIASVTNANHQTSVENYSNILKFESPIGSSGGRLLDKSDVTNIRVGSTATLNLTSCFIPPNVTQPQSVTFYLVCNKTLYQETLSTSQSLTIPVTGSFSYLDIVKGNPNIIATGTFAYESRINPNQANEIYYQGFEEYTPTSFCNTAKTGEYIYSGSFSLPLGNMMPGSYKLSYWKSTDKTNWQYVEQGINISTSTTSYTIGGTGLYLDEIRLCPSDAQMTTYTYKPLIGMTSQSDPKGTTAYYEYDNFGRLKLIKDDDNNVTQSFNYNYKH
jgi:YD repeat-containing protein